MEDKQLQQEPEKTVVAIVLDRSGSMDSCRQQTHQGLNSEIRTVCDHANGDTRVFLTYFDDELDYKLVNAPVSDLKPRDDYVPRGLTRLRDAVGETIKQIQQAIPDSPKTRYLVTTLSDGGENDSKIWSQNDLAELIRSLQATGRWTFAYIGANVDLADIQAQTGIDPSNLAAYTATPAGTAQAFATRGQSLGTFLRSDTMQARNFYGGPEGSITPGAGQPSPSLSDWQSLADPKSRQRPGGSRVSEFLDKDRVQPRGPRKPAGSQSGAFFAVRPERG